MKKALSFLLSLGIMSSAVCSGCFATSAKISSVSAVQNSATATIENQSTFNDKAINSKTEFEHSKEIKNHSSFKDLKKQLLAITEDTFEELADILELIIIITMLSSSKSMYFLKPITYGLVSGCTSGFLKNLNKGSMTPKALVKAVSIVSGLLGVKLIF